MLSRAGLLHRCCASLALQLAACLTLAESQRQLLISVMVTDYDHNLTLLTMDAGRQLSQA